MRYTLPTAALLLTFALPATAAPPADGHVRVATWNIENWRNHFEYLEFEAMGQPETSDERDRRRRVESFNNRFNWLIAQTMIDPDFDPDILVFQEGPSQEQLDAFVEQWLGEEFETAIVFPGNSGRGQTLGVIARRGFRVVEQADQFYTLPDPDDLNPNSNFLFARGPAFVLFETPGGRQFWVGTTHQKSKSGNSVEATRWRNAEAVATHAIISKLAQGVTDHVYLMGDLNDELGLQEFEAEAGGDTIDLLLGRHDGDPATDLIHVSGPLAEAGAVTFSGYWSDRWRSKIDHIIATPAAAADVRVVGIVDSPWAQAASDHLPLYMDLPDGTAE